MEFIINQMNSYDIFNIQDDDGNTPLHLLCKRIYNLSSYSVENCDCVLTSGMIDYDKKDQLYDHNKIFSNFSSRPSFDQNINLIHHISKFVEFSIENNEGKTPDEMIDNHSIRNYYYDQILNIRNGKFPSKINNNGNECFYEYFETSIENEWKNFFILKNSNRNNKTLMHFLCEGDRLSAIQFLVEQGADVNYKTSGENSQDSRKRFSNTNSDSTNEFSLYKDMNVNDNSLFGFLFCYHQFNKNYHPSGFFWWSNENIVSNLKSFIAKLNINEQYIINETEKIAEYLFDQGVEIIYEENKNLYLISDIIYKLLKKKKKMDLKRNKEDKNSIENIKNQENKNNISNLEIGTNQNDDHQSIKENKESSSTSQISKSKEIKLLQDNLNNNDKTEMEKPSTSNDNEANENKNQIKNSLSLSTNDQNKKDECLNNPPYDNTNPVRANLNLPVSLWEDIRELSILSGKSIDTVC